MEIPGALEKVLPHQLIILIHLGIHQNQTMTHGELQLQPVQMMHGVHQTLHQPLLHLMTRLEMEHLKAATHGGRRVPPPAPPQETEQ